jgi:hypothetical protein
MSRPDVHDDDPTFAACRAEAQAESHGRLVDLIIRAERRIRCPAGKGKKKRPPEKPKGADDVLAALATRFKPGQSLSVGEIARAAKCSTATAFTTRRWAKEKGLWLYGEAIAKGARP